MPEDELTKVAKHILKVCRARNVKLATAESCTGGLVAAALTEIAGSSDVFDRGFVTYSNAAKEKMLGVPIDVLGNLNPSPENSSACIFFVRALARRNALYFIPAPIAIIDIRIFRMRNIRMEAPFRLDTARRLGSGPPCAMLR